ncbi:peptidoglycan-binding domain-containing protein [Rhizobium sp. CECT 9324]|uniref:peptidoglycan-binding domain-containing protein n=1 Tax=Rhizobium sp. CECT 9324 TaxID=2845820 RepID=UPI001E608D92|nr:peptidoglycan-binding domain-containing protein [Rhizobium sp. CECT 9324]CAH0343230.1 hypothetical protein RHI9324_04963 [Rhizobium sp. CECT 9324]
MLTRTKLFCCTCLFSVSLGVAHGYSQDFGGVINLMGRMIEQDMHNQQERRQRDAEQRVYRQQQQAVRREEQARIDQERRKEIALVKRLQTALSKLGFYSSKIDGDRGPGTQKAEVAFTQAFGAGSITLDDYTIAEIEQLADRGFRSSAELRAGSDAGFENREDFIAARDGGFSNAQDFAVARQEGFKSHDQYKAYKLSGFVNSADFRIAAENGFSERSEFEAAKQAGFYDRATYVDFRASGHADKASYDKHKADKAAATAAFDLCKQSAAGDNDAASADLCLKAVAAGANDDAIKLTFEQLRERFEQQLAKMEKASNGSGTDVASVDGAAGATPSDASTFLVEQAKVRHVLNQLDCGLAIVGQSWSDAAQQCALPAQSDTSVAVQQLQTIAATEQKIAEDKAAKEQEEKRKAALEEQQRLALAAAHERMTGLLADIASFTEAKRSIAKPLDVAKALVRLRQLNGSKDVNTIEQALVFTEDLLKNEPDFQKFLTEKQKASEVAQVNARTTAVAELRRTSAFVESFVAKNLLDDSVNDLLLLQEKLNEAQNSGQYEQIFNMQKTAKLEIERLDLNTDLAAFVYEENAPVKSDVQQATNGLAVTDSNRALLEGERNDVLILGNFTAQAPHLLVDLVGNTTFDAGKVDACWISNTTTELPLRDHVVPALRSFGGQSIAPQGFCTAATAAKSDVVVIERGAFLKQNVLDVQPIVDAFERGDLKVVKAILWSDVGQSAENDGQLAETIRTEVLGKVRTGFGFLRFENASRQLCLVLDPAEVEFHQRALAIRAQDLERVLPQYADFATLSLDRAFAGVQKQSCGAIYAGEGDMARLLEGLQKINASYSVAPIWIDDQLVEEGRALSLRSEEEKQREIAARRQELEAEAAALKVKSEEAAVVRAKAQAELRDRYSQESRAAYNDIAEFSKRFTNSDPDALAQIAALFPDLASWRSERSSNGWVVDRYNDELVDYGTADWQGRRLEAVVIKTSVTTKNAVRGEYSDACFVLGYLIDNEFEMRRDPITLPCETASTGLQTWQTGSSFESRWVSQ